MKKIKRIADKIVELEKEYAMTRDGAIESQMNELISELSLTELLELDDYILRNYNLKN